MLQHRAALQKSFTAPKMQIVTQTPKLRVNLVELDYLEQAVEDVPADEKDSAIQCVVIYAKLHSGMCLKDESAYLRHRLRTQPRHQLRIA